MRTISYAMFRESISKHPECAKQLRLLFEDLKKADFENLN